MVRGLVISEVENRDAGPGYLQDLSCGRGYSGDLRSCEQVQILPRYRSRHTTGNRHHGPPVLFVARPPPPEKLFPSYTYGGGPAH